ncbi:MAG: hypothetical protein AAF740_03040 [Bacteroidota bacterium]
MDKAVKAQTPPLPFFWASDWDDELTPVSADTTDAGSATLELYRHAVEYFYAQDTTGEARLMMRELVSKVIRLHTQQGVSAYSQVNVPLKGELTHWQTSTKLPDGTYHSSETEGYKTIQGQEGGRELLFAFENVQIGGSIELMYIMEREASFSGIIDLQTDIPIQNASFKFVYPNYIGLDVMPKNCPSAQFKRDEKLYKGRIVHQLQLRHIPPLEPDNLLRSADQKRIYYRIASNERDKRTVLTWQDIGSRYAKVIYPPLSPETRKVIDAEIKDALAEIPLGADELLKTKALIKHVQDRYQLVEMGGSERLSDLAQVLENRTVNSVGLLRLYATLFLHAEIKHQPVLTSDKYRVLIDAGYPSWDFIQRILFYFPLQGRYFSPLQPEYGFGIIPPETADNKALFLNPTSTYSLFWTNIDVIEAKHQPKTSTEATYKLRLDINRQHVELEGKRELQGYKVVYPDRDAVFTRIKQAETAKDRLRLSPKTLAYQEIDKETWKKEQAGFWHSSGLLERAGETLLLRVGELFQLSKHSGSEASTVNLNYPESFQTTIELEIPEGYLIRNLEDLRKRLVYNRNDTNIGVECRYSLEKGIVKVYINEFYGESYYEGKSVTRFWQVQELVKELRNTILILEKY